MEATIEAKGLRNRFGSRIALDEMTFAIRPGQVTGFVRPNGARRSATKRVILGLDAADVGSALLDGMPYAAGPPARHDVRRVDEVIAQAGLEKVPG